MGGKKDCRGWEKKTATVERVTLSVFKKPGPRRARLDL